MSVDTAIAHDVPVAPPSPRRAKRPYLHQVDLFRIMTFACVIAVHVIGSTVDPNSVSANGLLVLLHFTREAFFALTGFVLVYQYAHRPFTAQTFWRRRFALVGIPYVAWSLIYWGYSVAAGLHPDESTRSAVWRLVFETATGGAWYNLYFLLVTMQMYLLFPLLLKLLRATVGKHRWVLAVSGAVQLVSLWWLVDPPQLSGNLAGIWDHLYATVIPYQFYMVLGAVAAWHIDGVNRWVHRTGPLLIAGAIGTAGLSVWLYLREISGGMAPWQGNNVFMPHLVPFFILIIGAFYTIGSMWAQQRIDHSRGARLVSYGSDRSFAVFLVHPLILQVLSPIVPGLQNALGMVWGETVLCLTVLAGALAAAELLRHLPGSLWLTGRPRLHTDPRALLALVRSPESDEGDARTREAIDPEAVTWQSVRRDPLPRRVLAPDTGTSTAVTPPEDASRAMPSKIMADKRSAPTPR